MDMVLKSKFNTFIGATGAGGLMRADSEEPWEPQRLRLCDAAGVPFNNRTVEHDQQVTIQITSNTGPGAYVFPPWSNGSVHANRPAPLYCQLQVRRMNGPGELADGDRVAFCSPMRVTQGGNPLGRRLRRKWLTATDEGGHDIEVRAWANSPGDSEIFEFRKAIVLPILLESAARWFQTPVWAAALQVPEPQYQSHFDKLRKSGYRLAQVNAISRPVPMFSDLWVRDASGMGWHAAHGLTEGALRTRNQERAGLGEVPVSVTRYQHGPLVRFAAVWWRRSGDMATLHVGNLSDEFQTLFDNERNAGRWPRSISASVEGIRVRLASVFGRLPPGQPLAHHGISAEQHLQHFDDSAHAGRRPHVVAGWRSGGEDRVASVWWPTGSEWIGTHNTGTTQLARDTVRQGARGREPSVLNGWATASGARWAGVWVRPRRQMRISGPVGTTGFCDVLDKNMVAYMTDRDIPGGQLAVTQNGAFVHCRAYTWDDGRETPVTPRTRFRLASISKTITAAAVCWLVQEGRLRYTDPVFGLLGIDVPSRVKGASRFRAITVDHLLTHTAGWKKGDPADAPFGQDPMMIDEIVAAQRAPFTTPVSTRDIVDFVLRRRPPEFPPGEIYSYSNFGYCLLGRVIEKVTNLPYETFVQQELLQPLGIQRMTLGRSAWRHRAAEEVSYFTRAVANSRNVLVPASNETTMLAYGGFNLENMDSHGGWIASAADLLRFAWALDRGHTGPNPLKPSTIDDMRSVRLGADGKRVWRDDSNRNNDSDRSTYGRGLMLALAADPGDVKASERIGHNGSLPGTRTEFKQNIEVNMVGGTLTGIGIAVLFNRREQAEDVPSDPEGIADWSMRPELGPDWNFSDLPLQLLGNGLLQQPSVLGGTDGA